MEKAWSGGDTQHGESHRGSKREGLAGRDTSELRLKGPMGDYITSARDP